MDIDKDNNQIRLTPSEAAELVTGNKEVPSTWPFNDAGKLLALIKSNINRVSDRDITSLPPGATRFEADAQKQKSLVILGRMKWQVFRATQRKDLGDEAEQFLRDHDR